VHAYDNNQEASAIAKRVEKYHSEKQVDYNSMAVLVRAAYQMRSIEEIFTRNSVPYRIVDGIRFYDRKEIKDLVAYLRLVYSDSDQPALERIINVPKRGIGAKTLESLTGNSNFTGVPVVLALRSMVGKIEFSKKINEEMESFLDKLDYWRAMSQSKEASLSQLVEAIANQSGYIQMLEAEAVEDPSAKSRIENVREFLSALSQFSSIDEFLEHIALFNAKDSSQEESAVNIMTIHASKGLEYDVVFLPGWEEGVFPSYRSLEDGGDSGLEEERRLAYVAITRARKWLTIIHVKTRFTFGKWNDAVKSRFVKEIADGTTADVVTFLNIAGFDSVSNQQNNMRDDYSQIEPSNYRQNSSLAPAVSSQPFLPEFAVDERIKHLKFGNGVVVSIVSQYAEVLFDDGCKHLIHRKFLLPLD
jgi:DNA helicase-2/ATP-dependent DNA helicase PcrA